MKPLEKLRVNVILFLLLFGISPLIFAGVITYAIISRELTEHIKEELLEIEDKLSKKIETLVNSRWNDVILYSKLPLIKNEADNKKKGAFLKEVLNQFHTYSWIGLTDEKGIVVASSNNENMGFDASSSWFKKGAAAGPAYVEEPHISQISDGLLIVSFSAPVYSSGGRFKGVLHAEVKMDAIAEDIKNIRIGRSGLVLLVRGDGIVIADNNGAAPDLFTNIGGLKAFQLAKKGAKGIIHEIDHKGVDSYISYVPLRGLLTAAGLEWYLLAAQSTDEIYAPSKRVAYIMVGFILMGVAGTALGSYFVSRGIIKPTERILAVVEAVAAGDFSKEVEGVSAKGEIGMLVRSINQMIKAVRHRDADVQIKARELTKLNEKLEMANIELRKTHAQLLRSGRLAAIGELSSKIAEDMHKPILNIIYNTQMAIRQMNKIVKVLPSGFEKCHDYIKAIEASSLACKIMSENILHFSKQEKSTFIPVNINEIIEEALSLIDYKTNATTIKIVKKLEHSLPKAEVNPLKLAQAMINIMLNAVEAMGEDGVLTISSEADSRIIKILICDSGIGIPPEDIERIFEPFFTTKNKEDNAGLGLGLTIAQSIIKEHNGMIAVQSSAEGTSIAIELPINSDAPRHERGVFSEGMIFE